MTNRPARNRPRADRAERTRVVRDRAERTRSRYASVRAFVERLNAQPYELFKPRRRPPLSSRQFSPSTRVYRCLIGSISRHAFNLCLANAFLSVRATLCLLNCCQAAFASSTVVVPLSPVIRCQTSVAIQPLSDLCCPSLVVGQWGGRGLFALCVAFSTDEWTRSGNQSVELEMDLVESRFVESRWK